MSTQVMAPLDVHHVQLRGRHLVEASAGTGKTWTLSMLTLRLVLESGLPIESILVVTFTNDAAAELRERIRARLAQAALALNPPPPRADSAIEVDRSLNTLLDLARQRSGLDDEALARRLSTALACFDEATIVTIHSFCQRALTESGFAAALPQADDVQPDDLEARRQVTADFWRREVAHGQLDDDLLSWAMRKGQTPDRWAEMLGQVAASPLAEPRWSAESDTSTATDESERADLTAAFEALRNTWLRDRELIAEQLRGALEAGLLAENATLANIEKSLAAWQAYLSGREMWLASGELADLKRLRRDATMIKDTKSAKRDGTPARKPSVVLTNTFFDDVIPWLDQLAVQERRLDAGLARLQQRMVEACLPALSAAKQTLRLRTYQDMQTTLRERLQQRPELVRSLRRRHRAALIDEFQDTDAVQLDIFERLFGVSDHPVFFVGDPKQSIYAFRGADLHSYLRARDQASQVSTLTENQRSTPALVSALNAVFGRNPKAFGDERLQYHPVRASERPKPVLIDRRVPSASASTSASTSASLSLWALPANLDGEAPGHQSMAKALSLRACAVDIAAQLQAAARGDITLDGRALRGGDIAVIVETHAQGWAMREALQSVGVSCIELSRQSIFASAEAGELTQLLHAILNPGDLRRLRAALATDALGWDATAIEATLANDVPMTAAATNSPSTALDQAVLRQHEWRALWGQRGVAAMLSDLFERVQLAERLLPRPDGLRRMTNWRHLQDLLHAASVEAATPAALLRWLEAQRRQTTHDDDRLLRLETDRELVQVITVHRAKGLQYPIVYAPLLWTSAGSSRRRGALSYHDDEGQMQLEFLAGNDADAKSTKTLAIKAQVKREAHEERLRRIYVALTRAVHRCVLVVDTHQRLKGASGGTKDSSNAQSLLNWLVASGIDSIETWTTANAKKNAPRFAQLSQAWRESAETSAGTITWREIDTSQPTVWLDVVAPDTQIEVPQPPGPIQAAWRHSSFTGLMRGVLVHSATPGVALDTAAPTPEIINFPRGAEAGQTIHALIEHVDFTAPTTWPVAIDAALARQPLPHAGDVNLKAPLLALLSDLSQTDLGHGFRLADLPPAAQRREVEFELDVDQARLADFVGILAREGLRMPALPPARLHERFVGFFRGAIDGVLQHEGRWHLVDWKSNHLGSLPEDYNAASIDASMVEHGYHLQHAIYAVAIWRRLVAMHGRDAAASRWGGAWVLYLRGIRPSWRDGQGEPCGVFHCRLNPTVLDALSLALSPAHAWS